VGLSDVGAGSDERDPNLHHGGFLATFAKASRVFPISDSERVARAVNRSRDVPAGTAIRFEPGVTREVSLVPLAGRRVVPGLRREQAGPLDSERPESAAGPGSGEPGSEEHR